MNAQERKPHASMDEASRLKKAQKVERLLSTVCDISESKVLEVGTGSGVIAGHFARTIGNKNNVHAVDLVDQRQVHTGFDFQLVKDTSLPFDDATFDICISNHVIEHVGNRDAQAKHLEEIHRVLKPSGWLYLAVPNRWTLIEPHYKLPFLSWLPRNLRDRYVRLTRRGSFYDCDPPSHKELESLLSHASFSAKDVSLQGIKIVADLEFNPGLQRMILQRPEIWAKPLRGLLPSYLYLAKPSSGRIE